MTSTRSPPLRTRSQAPLGRLVIKPAQLSRAPSWRRRYWHRTTPCRGVLGYRRGWEPLQGMDGEGTLLDDASPPVKNRMKTLPSQPRAPLGRPSAPQTVLSPLVGTHASPSTRSRAVGPCSRDATQPWQAECGNLLPFPKTRRSGRLIHQKQELPPPVQAPPVTCSSLQPVPSSSLHVRQRRRHRERPEG